MKKILTILAIVAGAFMCTSVKAQDTNWFLGTNAGLNVGYDGQREFWKFSNYGYGQSAEAYVGKWLSHKVALRAGYQGLATSVDRLETNQSKYGYVHGDLMLNLLNLICGNDVDSNRKMVRKLIIDALKYFVNEFDVDGFGKCHYMVKLMMKPV